MSTLIAPPTAPERTTGKHAATPVIPYTGREDYSRKSALGGFHEPLLGCHHHTTARSVIADAIRENRKAP